MVHSTLLPSITMLLLLLVCPSVFLRESLMKCKSGTGSEEGMNDEVEYVCFGDGKCGAIFCSADNGKFLYNDWGCFIGHYSAQSLVKLRMDEIDHYRAQHKLPPRSTGDQWQCTSQFGAIGVNMSNALFVPPLVKSKYQWNEWACFTARFADEECLANMAQIVNAQRFISKLPSPPNAKSVGF
ncbi:hypothetical protein niasHT_004094 [Heterodera trifolii]|uniref:Effector protein n=1 Tax=Heterodera trifolii TaxID=157864 RepID=A0ABD2LTL4_9BILA